MAGLLHSLATSPLKLVLQLSFRNLLRYRRRNSFLLASIAVSLIGIIFSSALIRGWERDLERGSVEDFSGHVKMLHPRFLDDPTTEHHFNLLDLDASVFENLELAGWAKRIRVPGVVSSERKTRGVQIVGIVPSLESISFLASITVDGKNIKKEEEEGVLIGKELAEQLETGVGRRIVLMIQGSDGQTKETGVKVLGVYDAEGTGYEKTYVITGLKFLQDVLVNSSDPDKRAGVVTELSILLEDEAKTAILQDLLQENFPDLYVADWRTLDPQKARMADIAEISIAIFLGFFFVGLIFGLINTLIASVIERIRELGLLRALGMRRSVVLLQVVCESLLIVSVGTVLGLSAGWIICELVILGGGIDMTAYAEGAEAFGINATLNPVVVGSDYLSFGLLTLLLGLLASYFPARRAMKISPLMAINR